MTKRAKVGRAPRAISSAEESFYAAEDALKKFKEDNAELMEELVQLVANRERARERLFTAVQTYRHDGGGMRVRISRKRTFDGEFLYRCLPQEVRDEVVSVTYKVDTKSFDKAVAAGHINEAIAASAFEVGDETVSVLKQIKPINLG